MQNMQNMQNMQSTQNPQSATTWTYNAVFITEERHTWVTKSGVATPLQAHSLAALLNLLGGQGWELTSSLTDRQLDHLTTSPPKTGSVDPCELVGM